MSAPLSAAVPLRVRASIPTIKARNSAVFYAPRFLFLRAKPDADLMGAVLLTRINANRAFVNLND